MVFPGGVWEADVEERYPPSSGARRVAEAARRELEVTGVPQEELRLCEAEGPDGTRLEDCLKLYVPLGPTNPLERPFGMVLIDVGTTEPALVLLAFGPRHQPPGARADTVYRRAHRRLHRTR